MTSQWYEFVLLLHAGTTGAMAGIIWFVQIVHYPLYRRVGADNFAGYQALHVRRTGFVVAPLMLVEAGTTLAFLMTPPFGGTEWLAWLGAALLALIWIVTFGWMVPLHQKLQAGSSDALIQNLIRWNWWRTTAWSARLVIALLMIAVHPGLSHG